MENRGSNKSWLVLLLVLALLVVVAPRLVDAMQGNADVYSISSTDMTQPYVTQEAEIDVLSLPTQFIQTVPVAMPTLHPTVMPMSTTVTEVQQGIVEQTICFAVGIYETTNLDSKVLGYLSQGTPIKIEAKNPDSTWLKLHAPGATSEFWIPIEGVTHCG